MAFKPDIDDLRESPATSIVAALSDQLPQGRVLAVEPNIEALPASLSSLSNVQLVGLEEALAEADVVVLLVDHSQFRSFTGADGLDVPVVDTRGAWRKTG